MNFIKKHKWIALASALLLPVLFFLGVVAVTGMQCCQDGVEGASSTTVDQRPSENEIAKSASRDSNRRLFRPAKVPVGERARVWKRIQVDHDATGESFRRCRSLDRSRRYAAGSPLEQRDRSQR